MLRAVALALLVAVTFSGCGGGNDGSVNFPSFVRAQVAASAALECADAVEINGLDFVNVLSEDENQFADLFN